MYFCVYVCLIFLIILLTVPSVSPLPTPYSTTTRFMSEGIVDGAFSSGSSYHLEDHDITLTSDGLDTKRKLTQMTGQVFIIYGKQDDLIPPPFAEQLFEARYLRDGEPDRPMVKLETYKVVRCPRCSFTQQMGKVDEKEEEEEERERQSKTKKVSKRLQCPRCGHVDDKDKMQHRVREAREKGGREEVLAEIPGPHWGVFANDPTTAEKYAEFLKKHGLSMLS